MTEQPTDESVAAAQLATAKFAAAADQAVAEPVDTEATGAQLAAADEEVAERG